MSHIEEQLIRAIAAPNALSVLSEMVLRYHREAERLRTTQPQRVTDGQTLQTGSRVELPNGPLRGTVLRVQWTDNEDGYTCLDSVLVRWDDGQIVRYTQEEDDAAPYLAEELIDVTPKQFLNVYLYDRAYGGPEEGGWWYNTFEPVADRSKLVSEAEGPAALEALQAELAAENKGRRHPSSVLSEGHYTARLEAWPAQHEPAHRPHYC